MDNKSKSGLLYHSGNLQHNDHKQKTMQWLQIQ